MTQEINPDELMPLPDRLKKGEVTGEDKENSSAYMTELPPAASLEFKEEPLEPPVEPQEAKIEASKVKQVIPEPEVVETDSEEIIKARFNAHQAMLRR